MAENTKKPAIRFAGFTEAWEQRKVREFLIESRVRGNTGLDAKKLTVKLWGKGVIEKNDFGGSEHTQYFTRRKGQFIYSKLDFLNSAFGVIPENLDNYESTADLPAFDLKEMNPYFIFFTAIQESFYLKHGSIADGSRKAKRIHVDTFLNMPIMVPIIDEQNLIVKYLQQFDHLITLHQRKYDKLTSIKKSMLEKMFPKNGNNVPEIRFKGFTEAWEQRKLGEVVTITSGFMGDSLLSDGKYHLTRIETIADGTVDESRIGYSVRKPDDIYLLKNGDILYSNINSISHMGKVAKYQGKTPLYHGINLLRLEPIQTINSDFMLYLLNTDRCRNWAKTRANQAVSQASINQSLLVTQEIKICSTNEQQKIGQYFSRLDNLITLHQRKLEKLKNLKKACLEKMFV